MPVNPNNFFYCEECQDISYRFECCGNTVCNGSGCEICDKSSLRELSYEEFVKLGNKNEFLDS